MLRNVWFFIGLMGLLVPALAQDEDSPQPTLPKVVLDIGPRHLSTEIARAPRELERGLMFRQKMGDNEGMLFCLTAEGPATFWMQNTLIPLSVAYLDRTGKILEIHDMQPLDTTNIRSTSDKVYYAIEVNQGWFILNKIDPGVVVKPENTTLETLRSTTPKS